MQRMRFVTLLCLPLFAVLLAAAFVQPPAVHAQAAPTVIILADRLNVRSGPGTSYGIVASAKSGEKYSVVGQNGSCAWLQIAKSGKTLGWVSGSKSYTRLNGTCSAIPSVAGSAAPAAGKAKQGCALLTNQLKFQVKLSVKRTDGWQSSWSIPAGGESKACVDPGTYTATFSASGLPGSMDFPVTVAGGEYYEIPLSMPGN